MVLALPLRPLSVGFGPVLSPPLSARTLEAGVPPPPCCKSSLVGAPCSLERSSERVGARTSQDSSALCQVPEPFPAHLAAAPRASVPRGRSSQLDPGGLSTKADAA